MSDVALKRGLGRGISALLEDENFAFGGEQAEQKTGSMQQEMPIAHLRPGRNQPRHHFDEVALRELSDSIREHGVMQPLLVRPSQEEGLYEILAGERRWRAAQLAGLMAVPVLVRAATEQNALECAIIENVQRQDLSPLEEAEGYQRLIEEFDYTYEKVGVRVGKSKSHVTNLVRLLALPEEVKVMLRDGLLTMGHARALITTANPTALAQEIVRKGLNVRQAELLAKNGLLVASEKVAAHPQAQTEFAALEEALSRNIGLKVRIKAKGNRGNIVIAYSDMQQLDDVLRKLGGV
jgi:ParB family chromosome partitioning protein